MQNILILLLRCKLLENKVNENNAKRCIENKIKKKKAHQLIAIY